MAYYKLKLGSSEFEHGKALYDTAGIVKSAFTNYGTAKWSNQNIVRTFNDSPNIQSRSTTANRFYGVEVDADGKMYVNVPWENTVGEDVDLSGYKTLQAPIDIVRESSDGSISFINSISQNENGEITGGFSSINLSGYKTKQEKYNFSGIGLTFINSISQNENGEIIANGKTLDLSEYATKNDIPSLNNYPTRDEINSLIPKPISISNKSATLTPGGTTTIATIDGIDITVGMPNISSGEGEMSADGVLSNVIADEGGNGEVIFDRTILGPISANLSHNHDILEVGSDGLYVTDSNKNVVAKINKDGIDSTNLKIKGTSISNIVNNGITGSGTSGYLAVFNGKNTIENGPAIGTYTTKYLRNDGQWTGIKQSDIEWGGTNVVDGISVIGAALSDDHCANRLAFIPADAISVKYSNNGGSSYTDSELTDQTKVTIVSKPGEGRFYIGGKTDTGTVSTNDRTQMIISANNSNVTKRYVYTRARKLLIYACALGHTINVKIEHATGASPNTWTDCGTYHINGWTGWNDIPIDFVFGGSSNQNTQPWYIRLTFDVSKVSTSSAYATQRPRIDGIKLIGETAWQTSSNYAKNGHIYSFDWQQNVLFPNNVTATQFNGPLNGNASTATALTIKSKGSATNPIYWDANGQPVACTHSLNASVPSTAVFTDTKVNVTKNTTSKAYLLATTSTPTSTATGRTAVSDTGVYLTTEAGGLQATKMYAKSGFFESTYSSSDERLKNFSDDIEVDFDKLAKLRKKYFTWKDDDGKQHIGTSAQDIQEIYPELVTENVETGYLSVDYAKLSVIALAAIDKLVDKQKDLEERLERLEKMIK